MSKRISDKRRQALLDDIKRSRSRFEALQDHVEEAKERYYEDVRALHADGMSVRDIADHVGVSHQRVHQILGMGKARRDSKLAKRLGAAGIIFALGLGTAALLDEAVPPAPPERITLVRQPSLTSNDIRDIKRYEEVVASGRAGGKGWRYLFAHLGGNFCSRFRWSPGPRAQGQVCGPLPPRRAPLRKDIGGVTFDPVMRNQRDFNPVPVVYGMLRSADIGEIEVTNCAGNLVDIDVVRLREVGVTLFYGFPPTGTKAANLTVTDLRKEKVVRQEALLCSAEGRARFDPVIRGFSGETISG
jgi:hypothetical protein